MDDTPMNMQNYEETYASFRVDVPEFYNFAFDVVDKWAEDRTKLALPNYRLRRRNRPTPHLLGPEGPVQPVRQHPPGPGALRKATVPSSCSRATPSGTSHSSA